jgi:hypothetical protein
MGMVVVCCGGCFCGLGVGVRSLLVFFFQNLGSKIHLKNSSQKFISKNGSKNHLKNASKKSPQKCIQKINPKL